MSLLVLAYPQIEAKYFDWIQSIRRDEDEKYFKIVDPHFTLVFPVDGSDEKSFVNHVESVSKKFKEFYFVLRSAQIVKDSFSDYYDVFLVPEEGYRIFIKIHDAFYTGPLKKDLLFDIPFIPHVGIANNTDPEHCKKIADRINSTNLEIVGAINKLSIVRFGDGIVKTVKEIIL